MNKKSPLGHLTPSICEAAFEEYAKQDDTLTELILKNRIEVRHFIILSFICDQEELSTEQIVQILGISLTRASQYIKHLIDAKMIQHKDVDKGTGVGNPLCLTPFGRLVVLRVHNQQDAV
jgi:predicted HTH transcriptional regulator